MSSLSAPVSNHISEREGFFVQCLSGILTPRFLGPKVQRFNGPTVQWSKTYGSNLLGTKEPKDQERKYQRAKEMTSQMVLLPRSHLTCYTVDRQSALPVELHALKAEKS